jgi:hypothetical protein
MTLEFFIQEMERIKTQFGAKEYSDERIKLFWHALRNITDEHFHLACDELILNHTGRAPVLKNFQEALIHTEKKVREELFNTRGLLAEKLEQEIAEADPEIVALCAQVISDTIAGRLTPQQRVEAQKMIDELVENKRKQKLSEKQGDTK